MAQTTDTAAIHRLIGATRRRIRVQGALEAATTALILAGAAALAVVFAVRSEWLTEDAGATLLIASAAILAIGAVIGASRRLDDEAVARRIDRASGLADRLSTAIAFRAALATTRARRGAGEPGDDIDDTTHDLMVAAIADGVRAAPRANVAAAAPFAVPRDFRAALGFIALSALVAGLTLPQPDRAPAVYVVEPDHAPPGARVVLRGHHLGQSESADPVPAHAVYLGPTDRGRPVTIVEWTADAITLQIPADAPIGDTKLTTFIGDHALRSLAFGVVDPRDARYHGENTVAMDPDDKAYIESLLSELNATAQREKAPELAEFAAKIKQMLADAEQGKLTKEQMLEAMKQAEAELAARAEPDPAQVQKSLDKLGDTLGKDAMTKELGDALKKHDLEKAKQELEKLADKLDKQELTEQQKQELAKQLEAAAQELAKQEQAQQQKQDEQAKADQQKLADELKKLEQQRQQQKDKMTPEEKQQLDQKIADKQQQLNQEQQAQQQREQQRKQDQQLNAQQKQLQDEVLRLQKQKDQAKTPQEQQDAELRLEKKQDELKKLEKQQDDNDKQESAQQTALKRLQRDMDQAAQNMQRPKPQPGQQQSQQQQDKDQQERERQASQGLKDAARETQRVDQDQHKQAAQKKVASQMDDLREAMRRAKQRGNQGGNDPFGKNGKNQDFAKRAGGGKGSGQAWKPGGGQGPGQQGQGQGQGQNGGNDPNGPGNGGKEWGTGHDPNLVGNSTDKSGNEKEQDLQGQQGAGSSRRETIVSAAQHGFSSVGYRKVFTDYQHVVEEVMRSEKMPASYKYYVNKYFAKIHPSTQSEPAPGAQP